MEWISVEERPVEFPCICCDINGNPPFIPHGIVTIKDSEGTYYLDYGKVGFMEVKELVHRGNRITHWMPLPKSPNDHYGEDNDTAAVPG